jgi:hypothetical protein
MLAAMILDLFPHLRATLRASSYFATDLGGFEDSEGRFKVFDDNEAPGTEPEYVTVEQQIADVNPLTDWTDPVVTFHNWGLDTRWHALWELAYHERDVFLSQNQFARLQGTFTAAANGTLASAGHGLLNGQKLTVSSSGMLPSGLAAATDYFVVAHTENSFQLSLARGGAAVGVTSSGSGTHRYSRAPLRYQVIGKATFDRGRDPVTNLVCVSLGLRFGLEA